MTSIIAIFLDVVLIGLLGVGIFYVVRLYRQLLALRASRGEMERFVIEFGMNVQRAEAGIRGLKQAAREGGDDLETMIDKAHGMRDELAFLVESADRIASRLSDAASLVARANAAESSTQSTYSTSGRASKPSSAEAAPTATKAQQPSVRRGAHTSKTATSAVTDAEKDLLQALKQLG